MATPSTARDLRRTNRSAILRELLFAGESTRQGLAGRTGLSAATVGLVIADLLDEGLVHEVGTQESNGGRPRTLVRMAPDRGVDDRCRCRRAWGPGRSLRPRVAAPSRRLRRGRPDRARSSRRGGFDRRSPGHRARCRPDRIGPAPGCRRERPRGRRARERLGGPCRRLRMGRRAARPPPARRHRCSRRRRQRRQDDGPGRDVVRCGPRSGRRRHRPARHRRRGRGLHRTAGCIADPRAVPANGATRRSSSAASHVAVDRRAASRRTSAS